MRTARHVQNEMLLRSVANDEQRREAACPLRYACGRSQGRAPALPGWAPFSHDDGVNVTFVSDVAVQEAQGVSRPGGEGPAGEGAMFSDRMGRARAARAQEAGSGREARGQK